MSEPLPVLLVDDDTALCESLSQLLKMDSLAVTAAHDGEYGVREALSEAFEIVILDVMRPVLDGRKVLRRIRLHSQIPAIMLTARGDDADRIAGLEAGADDYLPKPFNPRELVARIRAVLRRRATNPPSEILSIGDLEIQLRRRRVLQNGEELPLTGAEFEILFLLVRSAGKILTRGEIAESALGRAVGRLDRSIDNHISNLRKKLGPEVSGIERIRSMRGTGYCYTGETA